MLSWECLLITALSKNTEPVTMSRVQVFDCIFFDVCAFLQYVENNDLYIKNLNINSNNNIDNITLNGVLSMHEDIGIEVIITLDSALNEITLDFGFLNSNNTADTRNRLKKFEAFNNWYFYYHIPVEDYCKGCNRSWILETLSGGIINLFKDRFELTNHVNLVQLGNELYK
jgi:hypothetical protein